MACLAVITLIKDCYKILKSHDKQNIFLHFMGPTGSLKNRNFFAYVSIPTDLEHSNRLLLSLHSLIALSVYPFLLILEWYCLSVLSTFHIFLKFKID